MTCHDVRDALMFARSLTPEAQKQALACGAVAFFARLLNGRA
jgi:hypothetical protein